MANWTVYLSFTYFSIPNFSYSTKSSKIRRGPKLEGCAFANFGNSSGTEEEPSQKREKNGEKIKIINAASTGNRTRDLSITDQMSVLTNQVHLKIQFRHRFDQKCPFTDSLHRLGSRFARTSSVPLEMMKHCLLERPERGRRYCPPGVFFASWNFCWYDLHSF